MKTGKESLMALAIERDNNILHENYLKDIRGAFENYFRGLEVEQDDFTSESLIGDNYELLSNKVLKNKHVSKYLRDMDLLVWLLDLTDDTLRTEDSITLPKNLKREDTEKFVKKFLDFITGLPYEHHVYFQVYLDIPEEITDFEIHPNLRIIRLSNLDELGLEKSEHSNLSDAMRGYRTFPQESETYVQVKTKGYSSSNLQGSATSEAFRIFKQFIYFGLALGLLEHQSWKRRTMIHPLGFFVRDREKKFGTFELPANTQALIPKIRASDQFSALLPGGLFLPQNPPDGTPEYFEKLKKDFSRRSIVIKQFLNTPSEKKAEIARAIDWAYEGLANDNESAGFTQTCIALEAVLGDETTTESLTKRLADRCGYLLGTSRADRSEIIENFEALYKLRSKLIHGVTQEISNEERRLIRIAENYLEKAVLKETESLFPKKSPLASLPD